MDSYNEYVFQSRLDAALLQVKRVLELTRNPQLPAEVPHQYEDKYRLAEFLTQAASGALLQTLRTLGLSPEGLSQLREWAQTRAVTLRLRAQEDCAFLREETRKVESAQEQVTEWRTPWGSKATKTEKVVTTITEYFWRFQFKYELVAFAGTEETQTLSLMGRAGTVELMTSAKSTPRPEVVVRPNLDVECSWLLRLLDGDRVVRFQIDRADATCHTPRRNSPVDLALWAMELWHGWAGSVRTYFLSHLFSAQPDHGLDLNALNDSELFVPVLPLLEAGGRDGVLPSDLLGAFLTEQQRSIAAKCHQLAKVFPRDGAVLTAVEASLVVLMLHTRSLCQAYSDGVEYLEKQLEKQLVAAIGKVLTPADFSEYMDFHYRKLVRPEYRPRPFSHAVRRPEHDPEGVLSLEAERSGGASDPITTTVAWSEATRPMTFALDASSRVTFRGDRYLHAWVSHQFSGASAASLQLVARARQFSCFVLLVGRITAADAFEPKHAVIVQNKDLLKIPLMLEAIPTPKEFRDAIESLSPEQQRFAKAFRAMQLESTLFGVCVVQIKPQLEKLLRLDPDSLTKEIRLTQDLLNLFLEYQLPSDLVSYDGPEDAPSESKLARVRTYVERMQEMIDLSRKREVEEEREREAKRLAEQNRTMTAALQAPPPQPRPMAPPAYGAPSFGPPPAPSAAPMGGMAFGPPMPSPGPAPGPMPAPAPAMPAPAMAAPPPPAPAPEPPPHAAEVAPAEPGKNAQESPVERRGAEGQSGADGEALDYTRLPKELDEKFEALDEDGALRPTILHTGPQWSRTSQKGLLSSPSTSWLRATEQKSEKGKAFDLLDALTKSGALPVDHASLHVVLAATHCFDRTLLDTVIQRNVNPIEKVERSLMIVATTVHRRSAPELLAPEQRQRFLTYSPRLGPGEPEDPKAGA